MAGAGVGSSFFSVGFFNVVRGGGRTDRLADGEEEIGAGMGRKVGGLERTVGETERVGVERTDTI